MKNIESNYLLDQINISYNPELIFEKIFFQILLKIYNLKKYRNFGKIGKILSQKRQT